MPTVAFFFGLSIVFEYLEHNPPHFHVYIGKERVGTVYLNEVEFVGDTGLTMKQQKLIIGWAQLYQDELLHDWDLAREKQPLEQIPPLRK
jgi:hypothetical protein